MPTKATPERIAKVDAQLTDVYAVVIEDKLDEDLDEEQRVILYLCLRLAYLQGVQDGVTQMGAAMKERERLRG